MAVTTKTIRLVGGMRLALNAEVDKASQDIIRAWASAWNEVATEWRDAVNEIVQTAVVDGWPTDAEIRRMKRARDALEHTRRQLDTLSADFRTRVGDSLPKLSKQAAEWEAKITASQMPRQMGRIADLEARFDRADPDQIESIVKRSTERIHSLSKPLSADAESAMKQVLIRGISIGDHPSVVADRMMERVGGAFNGGRNRALVIARTEMLDAHRAAAAVQDKANSDVVVGWTWYAELDERTCPSCWAMHGTDFSLGEPGPDDHVQGRCTRVTRTASWKELGFEGIDEPADEIEDAETVFNSLPDSQQQAIMGTKRLNALRNGDMSWSDIPMKQHNSGWRDAYVPRPVK